MNPKKLRELLERVQAGEEDVDSAVASLRDLPFRDLGYATIDHHRNLRRGFPEVVFGQGKGLDELSGIVAELRREDSTVLVTRVSEVQAERLGREHPSGVHHQRGRLFTIAGATEPPKTRGAICIVSAGTSDLPVADEAAISAETLGNSITRVNDVGVAGLQRTLARIPTFQEATVLIVCAGMEGALPSVIAGLTDRPVIAVPTSVGYGTSFHGLAALLGMLNSCAAGVSVVNIDNGFGAAYAATLINRAEGTP
ncbi:MAG: nickel pincer cofactor biosynthesis protein LarB [Myxococcota bacterium]